MTLATVGGWNSVTLTCELVWELNEQFDIFGLTSKGFSAGDAVYITLPGGKRETFIFEPELDRLGGYLIDPTTGNGGLYHPKFCFPE